MRQELRPRCVAVVGGAGFIGAHLVDALVEHAFQVRVLDSLDPQVHPCGRAPEYLSAQAKFVLQDVRDQAGLRNAIQGVDAIIYLAGAVGVGDSMYKIRYYADTNILGAANLIDILANHEHSVQKVVLASSVTVYGEGKYSCPKHGVVFPSGRSSKQLSNHNWEPLCPVETGSPRCSAQLTALPIDEEKPLAPLSMYAITKRTQEEMFLALGHAYGIPVAVLRYFNVYGSRQAASNPYTGVAKIFAADMSRGKAPVLYEDGMQSRDFIHVSDVVQATLLALLKEESNGEIFNVGTGRPTTILESARALAGHLNAKVSLTPSQKYRSGDVRHCWANITKARKRLGFEPHIFFPAKIEDVLVTANALTSEGQSAIAHVELARRGLIW